MDKGANPFVVCNSGKSQYSLHGLQRLSNIPKQKSIYFITRPLVSEIGAKVTFPDPWFYRTGIFDGKFDSVVGQGASGTVVSGEWCGMKAAFKFVEIKTQEFQKYVKDSLKTLDQRLSEMTSLQETDGSKIVSFYGHYRYHSRYLIFSGQVYISDNNFTSKTTLALLFFLNSKIQKSTKPL